MTKLSVASTVLRDSRSHIRKDVRMERAQQTEINIPRIQERKNKVTGCQDDDGVGRASFWGVPPSYK